MGVLAHNVLLENIRSILVMPRAAVVTQANILLRLVQFQMCAKHVRINWILQQQLKKKSIAGATPVRLESMEVLARHVLLANTRLILGMLCVRVVI